MAKKRVLKTALMISAAAGAAYLALGNVLYNYALTPKSVKVDRAPVDLNDPQFENFSKAAQQIEDASEWYRSFIPRKIKIKSPRGAAVHADYFPAEEPSDIYAICLHGYTSLPEENAIMCNKFFEWGYNVLSPSLCGHGDSESKYVAMGWHDRIDIIAWINYIISENPEAKIILCGVSMGGAAVMMTTGENLPENVVCAIEDCGYTSVWDEFSIQIGEQFNLPSFPFLNAAETVTKLRAGYGLKEASSVEQVKKSKTPTLFIHGDKDDFVPFWMLDVVYENAACEKEKLIVENAPHAQSAFVEPELYWSTIKDFIEKYI